jgi:phytanoyl-CoA dioxygenase PhyH
MTKFLTDTLLFPLWVLSIFSKNKSFGRNPIIKNPVLNFLGLHVFRLVLAHALSNFRYILLSPMMAKQERKQFHENGYILLRNFLSDEDFMALENETKNYAGEITEKIEGDTVIDSVRLTPEKRKELPACKKLLKLPGYKKRLQYCAATLFPPLFFIQAIRQHYMSKGQDPQKTIHSDTFHPTMKAWLYLTDVTPENGPFKYIDGSHKLTWSRIKWEYRKSNMTARGQGKGGAFRFNDEDLLELGYQEPEPVIVPRNTLIIANTFGLHCRGPANSKKTRFAIWAHSRTNPFNPLPGFSSQTIESMRHRVIDKYTSNQNKTGKLAITRANWNSEFSQEDE